MRTEKHAYDVKPGDRVLMKAGDYAVVSQVQDLGRWRIIHVEDGRKSDELHANIMIYVDAPAYAEGRSAAEGR